MKYYFLLPLFMIFILSCTKEEPFKISDPNYQTITGKAYLEMYQTPDILFHYAKKNNVNDDIQGVFIDNAGIVHTYTIESPTISLEKDFISSSEMYYLRWKSKKTDINIDLELLVNNYKSLRKVKNTIEVPFGESSEIEEFYIAYDLTYDDYSHNGACTGIGTSQIRFKQILLKKNEVSSNSEDARTLILWMSEVLDYQLN